MRLFNLDEVKRGVSLITKNGYKVNYDFYAADKNMAMCSGKVEGKLVACWINAETGVNHLNVDLSVFIKEESDVYGSKSNVIRFYSEGREKTSAPYYELTSLPFNENPTDSFGKTIVGLVYDDTPSIVLFREVRRVADNGGSKEANDFERRLLAIAKDAIRDDYETPEVICDGTNIFNDYKDFDNKEEYEHIKECVNRGICPNNGGGGFSWCVTRDEEGDEEAWIYDPEEEAEPWGHCSPKEFKDFYNEVADSIKNTFKRKNADYGGSYENQCMRFGLPAILIPIGTKCDRLNTLSQKGYKPQVNESIKDTLQDLANYAIMGLAMMNYMSYKGVNIDNPLRKK